MNGRRTEDQFSSARREQSFIYHPGRGKSHRWPFLWTFVVSFTKLHNVIVTRLWHTLRRQ